MIPIDRSININEARAAAGPYFANHEGEAGGGFNDIALDPRLLDWPDIAHAAIMNPLPFHQSGAGSVPLGSFLCASRRSKGKGKGKHNSRACRNAPRGVSARPRKKRGMSSSQPGLTFGRAFG